MLRRERDRLAVIAGAGADDAPSALVIRKRRHQVDAAANLERTGRIVIFVFDEDVEPGFGGEERMPHQRRAAYQTVDPCACSILVECGRNHAILSAGSCGQQQNLARHANHAVAARVRLRSRAQRAPEFRLLPGDRARSVVSLLS